MIFVVTRASGTVRSGLADDLDRLRANRQDGLSELGTALLREFGAGAEALRDIRIVECVVDELGCDVERPIAEPAVCSRGSVVSLVGMQDHQLPLAARPVSCRDSETSARRPW